MLEDETTLNEAFSSNSRSSSSGAMRAFRSRVTDTFHIQGNSPIAHLLRFLHSAPTRLSFQLSRTSRSSDPQDSDDDNMECDTSSDSSDESGPDIDIGEFLVNHVANLREVGELGTVDGVDEKVESVNMNDEDTETCTNPNPSKSVGQTTTATVESRVVPRTTATGESRVVTRAAAARAAARKEKRQRI